MAGIEVEVEKYNTYSYMSGPLSGGRYECGPSGGAGDSGSQDEPKSPKWGGQANTRHDFQGNPINCYTEERVLTYNSDGTPVGSDGKIIDQYSNMGADVNITGLDGGKKDGDDDIGEGE